MSFPGAGRAGQEGASAGTVWDRQAGGYHRFFSQFTIPAARPLLDAARVTAGSTVLDAGAGPGYAARAARARGARVVAADLSAAMLACARHADRLLPLMRADAGTLPVAGGAFTAVVAGFCLPHMADPAASTAELARALAPGGWLAVSVWDDQARARHTGLLAEAIANVTGTPPPAPAVPGSRLRELLHAAGLSHTGCSTLSWVHPVPSTRALWDGLLASPVAAAAIVRRATPATQDRIRERFLALAAKLTDSQGTVRLPVSAIIAAAQRPPASRPQRSHGYRPRATSARRPSPARHERSREGAVVIDGGDRTCTALLLELRAHITQLGPGTVIHLISHDPAAPLDLAAWCHLTGHTYLGPVPAPADAPAYALRTSAACRPTQPHSPWRLTDNTQ